MELSNIIIGVVTLLAFVFLIWFINFMKKQKRKKLLQALAEYAENQNCKITESECIHDNLIGIDTNSKMLFFRNFKKNLEFTIDLRNIKKSFTNETVRNVTINSGNTKCIDKIELSFQPFDTKKQVFGIEFYNVANGDFQLSGELHFLEKWTQLINKNLVA